MRDSKKLTMVAAAMILISYDHSQVVAGNSLEHSTAQLSREISYNGAATAGDKAIFVSGNDADIYDRSTEQWSFEIMPTVMSFVSGVSLGHKAVFAGSNSSQAAIYDAVTGTWSADDITPGRSGMGATAVGNKAMFGGGWNGLGAHDIVDIYDDASDSWTTARLSQDRVSLAATTVGTRAFFAGGYRGDRLRIRSDIVDIYDDATGAWSTAKLSVPRSHLAATTVGTKAIFAGGCLTSNNIWDDSLLTDVVDIYDAVTDIWSTARLSAPRNVLTATTVGHYAIFAGGGYSSGVQDVDIYNALDDTWSTSSLSVGRGWLASTTVGDQALIGGGKIRSGVGSNAVDIYTLPEPATLSMLALGGLVMMRRRRRK